MRWWLKARLENTSQARSLFTIAVCFALRSSGAVEPTLNSAEYYYQHQDFAQALPLWQKVLNQQPHHAVALGRVCEMKLVLEGRAACRELLHSRLGTEWSKTPDGERLLSEYLDRFLTIFVTDDGQTAYLMGQERVSLHDFSGALAYFDQANNLEGGNLRVLKAKARVEKKLKRIDLMTQTLAKLNELHPLDFSQWDDWLEALYFNRDYDQLVKQVRARGGEPISFRQRVAYGLALVESESFTEAIPLLQGAVTKDRLVHPMVWYGLGKAFSERSGALTEATLSLERFIAVLKQPEASLIEGWDPYRAEEMKEPALKLLLELKKRMTRSS